MTIPNIAIVPSSVLFAEKRWDAPFHVALHHLRGRMAELAKKYSPEEAVALVMRTPVAAQRSLKALLRSGLPVNSERAKAAAEEYPYLALAIVQRDVDENMNKAIQEAMESVERAQDRLDALLEIARELRN